jgi:multimeric flavodoxin WrbA
MKALILNGAKGGDAWMATIHRAVSKTMRAAGWELREFILADEPIADCMGCFGCWVKTPGVCVIPDLGRDVAEAVIGSDLLVLLTPVTFGGYSSILKKAIDRIIPLLSPFFMKIHGEVHHQGRYDRYPSFLGIGVMQSDDEESTRLFTTLIERNALNYQSTGKSLLVTRGEAIPSIEAKLAAMLNSAGGRS